MKYLSSRSGFVGVAVIMLAAIAGATVYFVHLRGGAQAQGPAAQAQQAMPVPVAQVTARDTVTWEEFSGRLEAVERVEVRSRVAGAVAAVHFREGALVRQNDLLITIDPAPYAAEVERAEAQVGAAQARVLLTKSDLDRGQSLPGTITQRDLDLRLNANREAQANLRGAQAALQSAKLNLDYTRIHAPVTGRVGRLEITVGNLVAAGPAAPVMTTLVSVDPIYASFNADEDSVARALKALEAGAQAHEQIDRIPVQMTVGASSGTALGKLQLIDNQVDARNGTVRVRAVFENDDGSLMPGQFARLRMGQPKAEPALMVNERAVGTDQNKRFVMVVDSQNKAEYREITLGPAVDGLRMVTSGLKAGERIVVNGLQRVRPGAQLAPQTVAMEEKAEMKTSAKTTAVVQR